MTTYGNSNQNYNYEYGEYNEEQTYNTEYNDDNEKSNKLEIQKILDENSQMNISPEEQKKYEERLRYQNYKSKKKKDKKKKKRKQEESKNLSLPRRIVNLPASQPTIRTIDGEQRLCFKYNTKISDSAMSSLPKTELDENEFCVRFDLEAIDITKLNDKFKMDNCVYPRANVPQEIYTGNRWDYETECNKLAWQFVALNPILLYGKKGLIQRAVDSYRNINKQSRSRRIVKQEKDVDFLFKRRYSESSPLTTHIFYTVRGATKKLKVRIDIESVDYDKITEEFKYKYAVFPDHYTENSFGLVHWESNNEDNHIAVKIASLNTDNAPFWNAIKSGNKTLILKKAVASYKQKMADIDNYADEYDEEEERSLEIGDIVSDVVDKNIDDDSYFKENILSNINVSEKDKK